MSCILVTGYAGFIGHHVCRELLTLGHRVVGVDNFNDAYNPKLKYARCLELGKHPNISNFTGVTKDINDHDMASVFSEHQPSIVIHLAARAGVRPSLEQPQEYIRSNISGTMNILELCRQYKIQHLLYASSSSVYGDSESPVLSVDDYASHPVSIYAATKRTNELMAHTYAELYDLPCTGLRFFTVYGPWGRPDMAPMKFALAAMQGRTIDIYNNGQHERDFTYIDDIVSGILLAMDNPPSRAPANQLDVLTPAVGKGPFRVYNIGAGSPVSLLDFINTLGEQLGCPINGNHLPKQPGDVERTLADITPMMKDFGYRPKTTIGTGLKNLVEWLKERNIADMGL